MSSEQEIIRIGKHLEKLASSDTPNDEQALDMLKALQRCSMSLDVLQKSRLGMSVNRLRQKYSGSELASVAKKLIKQWKKLVPSGGTGQSPGTGLNKDHKQSFKAPRSPSRAGGASSSSETTGQHQNPPTPPPVTYTSNPGPNGSSGSNTNNGGGAGSSSPMPNGQVMSPTGSQRRDSTQSDDGNIQLMFAPNIDGSARAPSTGNDVRDRCRDLIAKALKKGFVDVSIEEEIKLFNLASEIENCVHSEFRDTGNKYKMRIRSRVSNLGDLKNPSLRQNVISGQVPPSRIAVMTSEEMASDDMKKMRQQFVKESIRDAQMATSGGTKTSLLKCGKCGKRNCTYTQAQTRSADEPMTTFAYCNECGHRWKFC